MKPANRIAENHGAQTAQPLKIEVDSPQTTLVIPPEWQTGMGMRDGLKCVLKADGRNRFLLVVEDDE